jgi:hypothetical protein
MSDLCRLIWCALIGIFRPRAALQAEILVLRHQLNVLRRKSPKRLAFGNVDRLVFTALYRVAPGVLDALKQSGDRKPAIDSPWHLGPCVFPCGLGLVVEIGRLLAAHATYN